MATLIACDNVEEDSRTWEEEEEEEEEEKSSGWGSAVNVGSA